MFIRSNHRKTVETLLIPDVDVMKHTLTSKKGYEDMVSMSWMHSIATLCAFYHSYYCMEYALMITCRPYM